MVAALPSTAKLVEARLAINAPSQGAMGDLDKSGRYGAVAAERWEGEILFAPLITQDALAFQAWLNSLDGRKTPFTVRMPTNLLTHYTNLIGSLAADTVRQSDSLRLTAAAGQQVLTGTLLAIGSTDSANYQMCEVLTSFITGTNVQVFVAPRIRTVIASGTNVQIGNGVHGKFILQSDAQRSPSFTLDRAAPVLSVTEALN